MKMLSCVLTCLFAGGLAVAKAAELPLNLRKGLVFHYDFEAAPADGKVADRGGRGLDGQATNVTWEKDAVRGGVARFGMNNSYIVVPNSERLDPQTFTLAAWVKTTTKDEIWRRLFDKTGWDKEANRLLGYDLTMGGAWKGNSSEGQVGLEGGKSCVFSGPDGQVADGRWHHVAGIFGEQTLLLFVDGKMVRKMRRLDPLTPLAASLGIGGSGRNLTDSLGGSLDDAMMYDRKLAGSEVRKLFELQGGVLSADAVSADEDDSLTAPEAWVIPTAPKPDKDGWIPLFDGKHLYACDPKHEFFNSGKVQLGNGVLRLQDAGCMFQLAAQSATLRMRVKKVSGQNFTTRIGPYFVWFNGGNVLGIDRHIIKKEQILRNQPITKGNAFGQLDDYFNLEFTVHGGQASLAVEGAVIANAEVQPIRTGEENFNVWAGGVSLVERVDIRVLGGESPPAAVAAAPAPTPKTPVAAPPAAGGAPLDILSEQAPNATAWALAPLEQVVPSDIRQNLVRLREELLDEAASAPRAGTNAYSIGSQLCNGLIATLDERERTAVRAGYVAAEAVANTRVTSQALEASRNSSMSWPQYARELDQRGEIQRQQDNEINVVRERIKVEWSTRMTTLRRTLDALYANFREALRQGGK